MGGVTCRVVFPCGERVVVFVVKVQEMIVGRWLKVYSFLVVWFSLNFSLSFKCTG